MADGSDRHNQHLLQGTRQFCSKQTAQELPGFFLAEAYCWLPGNLLAEAAKYLQSAWRGHCWAQLGTVGPSFICFKNISRDLGWNLFVGQHYDEMLVPLDELHLMTSHQTRFASVTNIMWLVILRKTITIAVYCECSKIQHGLFFVFKSGGWRICHFPFCRSTLTWQCVRTVTFHDRVFSINSCAPNYRFLIYQEETWNWQLNADMHSAISFGRRTMNCVSLKC